MLCRTFLALAAASAGVLVCRRIAARHPDTAAGLQSRARHLYLAIPMLLAFLALSIYITANPARHWNLPWIVQLHYSAIHWGGISCILGYVFGFCCTAGFLTVQREDGSSWDLDWPPFAPFRHMRNSGPARTSRTLRLQGRHRMA